MTTYEETIEEKIQDAGLTAARVTPDIVDKTILTAQYHQFPGTTVTVCCLTLQNGFTVIGESACASPENFNEELGKEIAYNNARQKIWALEGYVLRDRIHRGELTSV